ncbi:MULTISPECIES: hypothetical protein [Pseudomonas]|jgi:hypothetical protein|uniref:Uncharacterized protein n=2 Tax=Pseudomonas TaxID=286 RepID=A0A7X1GJS8_9PSED|nr:MULTISPECIES: hypothetical protein [Pseudomonas]MBC2693515.1 hypothetical protein [Pseudomonas kielensis]MDD1011090.1 hypothetical protein [Pseudomonas shahriarae]
MNAPDPQAIDADVNHQIDSVDDCDSVESMRDTRLYIKGYLDALFKYQTINASTYHDYQKALDDRLSKRLDAIGEDPYVTVTYP